VLPSNSIWSEYGSEREGDFAVRCRLNIKTTMGDEFEAEVIKFDKPSNIVVLQESAGNGL
jgi:hypothetical protein